MMRIAKISLVALRVFLILGGCAAMIAQAQDQGLWNTPALDQDRPEVPNLPARAVIKLGQPGVRLQPRSPGNIDEAGGVRLIVEFRSEPIARAGNIHKGLRPATLYSVLPAIQAEHAKFKTDLTSLDASYRVQARIPAGANKPRISFEYSTVFNGVAVTAARELQGEILKLPYVAGVWEDRQVEALDDLSNAVIGAPAFWDATGVHGEGIDLAILDTGIDYLHEAFGGYAYFPNPKVVGGRDYVPGGTDVMDDFGHGTHVAGIAAAEGPPPTNLRGVAYKARLWAFKVLNDKGMGLSSWIIAGIEGALDPDGDPSTPTPIDVISMSFGAVGDPDDPISQAVDNAVKAGVVCVTAAGNWGWCCGTIASPGCARQAISVGASDGSDSVASFSSQGPSPKTYGLKPDLVAPGVNILSAQLSGGYVSHSGTSMATPQVAGAAALLLQLHPDWTPLEVKAALMQTGRDLGESLVRQGAGLLSLTGLVTRDVVATPGSLHFGVDDVSGGSWTSTRQLVFRNSGDSTRVFNLTSSSSLAGISLSFAPATVSIGPGATVPVTVTLTVNNQTVPYKNPDSSYFQPDYFGAIVASCSTPPTAFNIPFAFIKMKMIRVYTEETPWWILTHAAGSSTLTQYSYYGIRDNDTLDMILWQEGTYDLVGAYRDGRTFFVKEDVVAHGVTTLTVRKDDSKNRIVIHPVDRYGTALPHAGAQWAYYFGDSVGYIGYDLFCPYMACCPPPSLPDTLFFSDVSPRYELELKIRSFTGGSYYEIPFLLNGGISESVILENGHSPDALMEVDHAYRVSRPDLISLNMSPHTGGVSCSQSFTLQAPFTMKGYYGPTPRPGYILRYTTQYVADGSQGQISAAMTFGPKDTVRFFRPGADPWNDASSAPFFTTVGAPLPLKIGFGPLHWLGSTNNSATAIRVSANFAGQLWWPIDLWFNYRLFAGAAVLDSESMSGNAYGRNVAPGKYTVEIAPREHVNSVGSVDGNTTVKLEFDLAKADPNPPSMASLMVLANGVPTDELYAGDANTISFELVEQGAIDSATLFYASLGSGAWIPIPLARSGDQFTAGDLSDLPDGYSSLRIRAVDSSGNALDLRAVPALLFHRLAPGSPAPAAPADGALNTATRVNFRWSPSPHAEFYHLQVATDSNFNTLAVDEPAVANVSWTVSSLGISTRYYWRVSAGNVVGSGAFSPVRSFTTSADPTYLYGVEKRWNLVSLPLHTANAAKADLYPASSSPAFRYDGTSYVAEDTMRNGRGYWLTFDTKDTVAIPGQPVAADTIDLTAGWNLIGSLTDPVGLSTLRSIPPELTVSWLYGYSGIYEERSTIEPGKGYWLHAGAGGRLILTSTPDVSARPVRVMHSAETPPPPPGGALPVAPVTPREYALEQCFPNPFNPTTVIRYQLPSQSSVKLEVYNLLGQVVATLVDEIQGAGYQSLGWNASGAASGAYYYRLEASPIDRPGQHFSQVKKLLLIK